MTRRAGSTAKISISLRTTDLAALRKRAKRLHGGNISAAIAELAADAALLEGMHALVERLGGSSLEDADRDALDRAWRPRPAKGRSSKRVA